MDTSDHNNDTLRGTIRGLRILLQRAANQAESHELWQDSRGKTHFSPLSELPDDLYLFLINVGRDVQLAKRVGKER